MFFKGYVPTRDKQCLVKFKGKEVSELLSLKQVQSLPEFAGILDDEIILIDIDDQEQSEILFEIVKEMDLKCRVYKTTRGKHFLFKNNGVATNKTGCKLAIGLTSDVKLGCKNSYSVLKFGGKDREIIFDGSKDSIGVIPKWMTPVKTSMEFLDMKAGDGRNQALFNFILTLQAADFTVEEARETIRIINGSVLKVPLKASELEVILRDDAFQKQIFFKGTAFLFDQFATYIKNNNHIIRINNQLHLYDDGIYISGLENIESQMIKHIPQLNRSKRTEVTSYLDIMIRENTTASPATMIAFDNGILNTKDGSFSDFSPDRVITNKIPWDYNPAAYSKVVDDTLNNIACHDSTIRSLLEEAAGSCLFRSNTLSGGKAFILTGIGANGKSTYLNMVKAMLGEINFSSLDLKELSEKFLNAELFGKLANIGDDINSEYIQNAAIFRKLVTGERIQVQKKGQNPFEFNNYAKLMFSANNIPRMGGVKESYSIMRRLVIIPFNASFTNDIEGYDPNIRIKLQSKEAIEYLIQIGRAHV